MYQKLVAWRQSYKGPRRSPKSQQRIYKVYRPIRAVLRLCKLDYLERCLFEIYLRACGRSKIAW